MGSIFKIFLDIVLYISVHPIHVLASTAIISAICVFVISLLRRKIISANWAWYFQYGFATFTVSYSLQCVGGYLVGHGWLSGTWGGIVTWTDSFIAASFSSLNNLLFLAAARNLLRKRPILPKWTLCVAPLGLLRMVEGNGSWADFGCRLPVALFSIYCLIWIGYATGVSISFRRGNRRILGRVAISVAMLYAIVEIYYAFIPLLADNKFPVFTNILFPLLARSGSRPTADLLNALGIALVLPLKFGLFVSGLLVLLHSFIVVSSETVRKMLTKIVDGSGEDLISEEMLKSLSEEVDAEKVELVLRLPGRTNEQVAQFTWSRQTGGMESKPEVPLPPETSDVGRVLRTGNEEIPHNSFENTAGHITHLGALKPEMVSIAVPILYHKAVIGCLRLETSKKLAQSAIATQHVRDLASLASFAAQSYRELAAATQFSNWFVAWRVGQKKIMIESAVQKVAEMLYDILSPQAVIISVDAGFHRFEKRVEAETHTQPLPTATNDYEAGMLARLDNHDVGAQPTPLVTELGVKTKEGQSLLELGQLVLVVPTERDNLVQPTLGTHHLHRQTIGALLNEMLLGIMRDHLQLVLKDFGVRLNNNHSLDFSSWLVEVNRTAREAGMMWAVAANPESNQISGEEGPVAFISDYRDKVAPEAIEMTSSLISHPVADAHCLLVIQLPVMGLQIWMGVNREGFGRELDTPTPWRVFLERFADIADSALVRVTAAAEMQRMQMEYAQTQALATMAVTTGTLVHQLTNLVNDISAPIGTLNEALLIGRLQAEGDLQEMIISMQQSADNLFNLLSETMLAGKIDEHRPCSLLEAAQQSRQLPGLALSRSRIRLEISVDSDLVIDVPFHVASLAISNLVSNAIEAMKRTGRTIRIAAEDSGEMIHCYVTDDGPGVHPSMRDRLFRLGATTKRGSGGWGLYLVHRSLVENGGHIELTNPAPGETKFTIRFPKSDRSIRYE